MGLFFSKDSIYVSRDVWDARNPTATFPFRFPIKSILVTAVSSQNSSSIYYKEDVLRFLRELQKYEVFDQGLPDIAYNFYVGADGRLYEGRGWASQPSLQEKENPGNMETLAIAYVRPAPGAHPSHYMAVKVKEIIENGIEKGWVHPNFNLRGMTSGLIE